MSGNVKTCPKESNIGKYINCKKGNTQFYLLIYSKCLICLEYEEEITK